MSGEYLKKEKALTTTSFEKELFCRLSCNPCVGSAAVIHRHKNNSADDQLLYPMHKKKYAHPAGQSTA
jgi:hypothetical protein